MQRTAHLSSYSHPLERSALTNVINYAQLRAKPHKFQIFQKKQALMSNLRLQIVFCIIAVIILILFSLVYLQWFDAVGWAAGRASGL